MPRVKRGVTARARHKKVLALAKGFRGRRKNVFRIAKEAVMSAGQYAYRDRRTKKRVFRQLWIARINAASRELGVTYSKFMAGLKKASDRHRPQGPRRHGRQRSGRVRQHRREGEGPAALDLAAPAPRGAGRAHAGKHSKAVTCGAAFFISAHRR